MKMSFERKINIIKKNLKRGFDKKTLNSKHSVSFNQQLNVIMFFLSNSIASSSGFCEFVILDTVTQKLQHH